MRASIDHLAVAGASLDGRLLDDVLGVSLSPGGRHARMGTHNRLLRLGDGAYLELIAIDPQGTTPAHPRWLELDDPAMRARLAEGPRLVHWLARVDTTDIPPLPFDVGPWGRFERGDLSFQLTVRADGTLPADGAVPSLICWRGSAHPAERLPEAGVSLEALELEHPRAGEVQRQLDLLGLDVRCTSSALPRIVAHLRTPSGPRTLRSTEPIR
jgi:Glyoxalase-like domain